MVNLQKLDSVAVIIMIIIGLIFFFLSMSVFKNLDASCPSSTIRNGWSLIQTLGACMSVAGIAYFVCTNSGDCYTDNQASRTIEVYLLIFGVFSLIMIGMCSAILKEYQGLSEQDKQNCEDKSKTTQRSTMFVLIMSALGLIFTGGIFIKIYLQNRALENIAQD